MHVAALGVSVLKGSAQDHPSSLRVLGHGPESDRAFCCVDPGAARVLRTVQHPRLLQLRARTTDGSLTVQVPGHGDVTGPVRSAGPLTADYWGRPARLDVLAGPWADVLSGHLGTEVVLARAAPRDVVYGGGVTLVTTASLRELASRAGLDLGPAELLADAERWRASVVVDTGDAQPFVEDGWLGRRLRLGPVELEVRAAVPRCAVVRLRPRHGDREPWDALALLAPDRVPAAGHEVVFGVDAEVVRAGTVTVGDPVAAA